MGQKVIIIPVMWVTTERLPHAWWKRPLCGLRRKNRPVAKAFTFQKQKHCVFKTVKSPTHGVRNSNKSHDWNPMSSFSKTGPFTEADKLSLSGSFSKNSNSVREEGDRRLQQLHPYTSAVVGKNTGKIQTFLNKSILSNSLNMYLHYDLSFLVQTWFNLGLVQI